MQGPRAPAPGAPSPAAPKVDFNTAAASPPQLGHAGHPDTPLFAAIRDRAPAGVSEDHLARATLLARQEGITVERLRQVGVHDQTLWWRAISRASAPAWICVSRRRRRSRPAPSC